MPQLFHGDFWVHNQHWTERQASRWWWPSKCSQAVSKQGLAGPRTKPPCKKLHDKRRKFIPLGLSILLLLRVQRRLRISLGPAFLLLLSIYTFISTHAVRLDEIEHGLLLVIRGALPIKAAKIPGLRAPASLEALVSALLCATELLRPCIGSLLFLLLDWETAGEPILAAEGISNGLCARLEMVMPGCCIGTGGGRLVGGGG